MGWYYQGAIKIVTEVAFGTAQLPVYQNTTQAFYQAQLTQ